MNQETKRESFDLAVKPDAVWSRAGRAIVRGGLTVGILDGLAAILTAYILRGTTPALVFQYIASALLGRGAYDYGGASVVLGIGLHFLVALTVTAIYYFAARRLPLLLRQPLLCGALYGIVVYFVMQRIVHLSAAATFPFSTAALLRGILTHILCVGIPLAVQIRRTLNER